MRSGDNRAAWVLVVAACSIGTVVGLLLVTGIADGGRAAGAVALTVTVVAGWSLWRTVLRKPSPAARDPGKQAKRGGGGVGVWAAAVSGLIGLGYAMAGAAGAFLGLIVGLGGLVGFAVPTAGRGDRDDDKGTGPGG